MLRVFLCVIILTTFSLPALGYSFPAGTSIEEMNRITNEVCEKQNHECYKNIREQNKTLILYGSVIIAIFVIAFVGITALFTKGKISKKKYIYLATPITILALLLTVWIFFIGPQLSVCFCNL